MVSQAKDVRQVIAQVVDRETESVNFDRVEMLIQQKKERKAPRPPQAMKKEHS